MPFIPHTEQDVSTMLAEIGALSIEALFDEVPKALLSNTLDYVPAGISEMELSQEMSNKAAQGSDLSCFVGAGAYQHHIPAAVWDIANRGEFMTIYTPYQAEASQGSLQVIYEFQTMMANLMAMDISNASLYDGASGLAEAVLMAVRANRRSKSKQILIAGTIHPNYKKTVDSIVSNQGVTLSEIPFNQASGRLDLASLSPYQQSDIAALVIPQPNFFGVLEAVDQLTDWAHGIGAMVIACVNPMAMALIKPPGQWGQEGVDIACGEGQPLGVPLASGGPYFGFICCRKKIVRQLPGRLIGRTVDTEGRSGFTLTLQAREQHIRRSKATSNICTNQGLLVTAATIYMSLLGPTGLQKVAGYCHANTLKLAQSLSSINGVKLRFSSPYFHEVVLELPRSTKWVLSELAKRKILGGFALANDFSSLSHCLLVCATEVNSDETIEQYHTALTEVLKQPLNGDEG